MIKDWAPAFEDSGTGPRSALEFGGGVILPARRISAVVHRTGIPLPPSSQSAIDSMVLICATSYFPNQARAIMRRASFDNMPQQVKEMCRECAKRGEEQICQLITQFNAFHKNYDDTNFIAEKLSAITARTLIVHGDRDRFFLLKFV